MKNSNGFLCSIVVVLGGFLFHFNAATLSGAELPIQKFWNIPSLEHGLLISIVLIRTRITALLNRAPSDKQDRKAIFVIANTYLPTSFGTAFRRIEINYQKQSEKQLKISSMY